MGQPPGFHSLTFLTYGSLDLLSPGSQPLPSFLRNGQSSQTTASIQKNVTGDNQGTRTCRVAAFDVRKERLKVFSEIHGQGYGMFCLWYLLEKGTVPEKEGSIVLGSTVPRAQLSFSGQQPTSKGKGHSLPPCLLFFPSHKDFCHPCVH